MFVNLMIDNVLLKSILKLSEISSVEKSSQRSILGSMTPYKLIRFLFK
jgi:hypothetical protein